MAFLKGGPSFLCVDHFTKTRVGVGLGLKKFEYDSRLKADLIKFIKLNSTFLNFYYHFEIPHLS